MPQPVMLKKLKLNGFMKTTSPFGTNTQKGVLFIIGDWNAKQEVKKHLESQADLALECGMKQGKD